MTEAERKILFTKFLDEVEVVINQRGVSSLEKVRQIDELKKRHPNLPKPRKRTA